MDAFLYYLTRASFTNQVSMRADGSYPATVTLPDGAEVAASRMHTSDPVTWWTLRGDRYVEIPQSTATANDARLLEHVLGAGSIESLLRDTGPDTDAEAFVQLLWLHHANGTPFQGWAFDGFTITQDQMREAVNGLSYVLDDIQSSGYTEAEVWAYTQAEAPWAVDLVGVPPA